MENGSLRIKMDKIKVLIVAGAMNVGGIENQLMHLSRQADKEKFQIDFTSTEDHPFYQEEMLALGARCIQIPKTEGIHFCATAARFTASCGKENMTSFILTNCSIAVWYCWLLVSPASSIVLYMRTTGPTEMAPARKEAGNEVSTTMWCNVWFSGTQQILLPALRWQGCFFTGRR